MARQLWLVIAGAALLAPPGVWGQDPFEIEVYGYETAPRFHWELGVYGNYTARGSTAFDGRIAPTRHQGRLTIELTRGLTGHWEATVYVLSAYRPGVGFEVAGARFRSRVRLPEGWNLPIDVGAAAELEIIRSPYDENATALELRPIFEKRLGRLGLAFNPVFERGLSAHAGAPAGEWEFEPSARVAVTTGPKLDLSLEYYGKMGLGAEAASDGGATHQVYPAVDLRLGDDLLINLGVGFGTARSQNRLILKTRIEVPLGG